MLAYIPYMDPMGIDKPHSNFGFKMGAKLKIWVGSEFTHHLLGVDSPLRPTKHKKATK